MLAVIFQNLYVLLLISTGFYALYVVKNATGKMKATEVNAVAASRRWSFGIITTLVVFVIVVNLMLDR
ncbi:MAG: hypothetical protein LBI87_11335 [Candidatus Accumulibacter sp.]|nr:hypothetical protein [Accumulibacter sp.]